MSCGDHLLVMLEDSGQNLLLAHTAEDIQEMTRALSFKPKKIPHVVASIVAAERKKQLPVLEKIVRDALENRIVLEELLPNIRTKTLVMWGKHDRVLHVSSVEVLQEKLSPEAQLHVVLFDDCGHIVQHEKHAEVTAAINKLLSDQVCSEPSVSVQGLTELNSTGKLKQLAVSARIFVPSYRKVECVECFKGQPIYSGVKAYTHSNEKRLPL